MEAKSILTQKDYATITQPSNSLSPDRQSMETISVLETAFWIVTSMMLVSISMLIYARIPKRRKPTASVTPHHQVACAGCKYFNNNNYVKCAIHPVTVMTEQAIDCADYSANSKLKRV
jgi:hypothetical protein